MFSLGFESPLLVEQSPSEEALPLEEPEDDDEEPVEEEDDEPGGSIH